MAKTSHTLQQDCNLPANERKTVQKGNSKRPMSSSVAPMVFTSTSHVGNTGSTGEGNSTEAPSINPTDVTLHTFVDLLKKWAKKKTSTDPGSDEEEQAMDEWHTVAMVTDHVMLVVFTVLTLIIYTVIFSRATTCEPEEN